MTSYGLLFDQSRCVGCRACEQACQAEHNQPPHEVARLDERSYTWVETVSAGVYQRHLCMSCLEPTCASVCPVAALQKTPEGPVVWNAERCLGCRYCIMACPFSVPRYEWHNPNPRVQKCDMCVHRVSQGRETACASICPTGATQFGRRDDLLAEAGRRHTAAPGRYADGVYGTRQAGGTAVLMLLSRPAAEVGLPAQVPEDPLPRLTWNVLSKLPRIIPLWAAFLGGMYWLTERKNTISDHQRGEDHHD